MPVFAMILKKEQRENSGFGVKVSMLFYVLAFT